MEVFFLKLVNKPCSEFGKSIKKRLIEMDKTQNWLIEEFRLKLPDTYIDGSLLHKIIVGNVSSGKAVDEIHRILEI